MARDLPAPAGALRRTAALGLLILLGLALTAVGPRPARAQSVVEIIRKATESLVAKSPGASPQEAGSSEALLQSLRAHVEELQKRNEAEKDSILQSIEDLDREQERLAKAFEAEKDERRRNLLSETTSVMAERRKVLRSFIRLLDDEVKTAKGSLQVIQERSAAGAQAPPREEREFFNFTEAEVASREARLAEGRVELIRARLEGFEREQKVVAKEAEDLRWQLQDAQGRLKSLQDALQGPGEVAGKPLDLELLKLEVQKASQALSLREAQSRYVERRLKLLEAQRALAAQELKAATAEMEAKQARAQLVRARTVVTAEEAEQAAKQKEKAEAQILRSIEELERSRDRVEEEKVALERRLDRSNEQVAAAKTAEERELAEASLNLVKLKLSLVDRQVARLEEEIALKEEQLELERQRASVVRQKFDIFQGRTSKTDIRRTLDAVEEERKALRQKAKAQEIKKEVARQAAEQAEAAAKVASEKVELLKKSLEAQPKPHGSSLLSVASEEAKVHQTLARLAGELVQIQSDRERAIQDRLKVLDEWFKFLHSRAGNGWALTSGLKSLGQNVSHWMVDFGPYLKVLGVLILGLLLAKVLARLLERAASERVGKHVGKIGGRVAYYVIIFLALLFALSILNIRLATVLAAAGVLTIAVGFAAQTTLANMISGMMLLGDRPFHVDDFIEVENQSGFVVSIDLLSTKLRTLDNTLVRIPNETLIKSTVRNVTRYDIRRLDIDVGVTYYDDLDKTQRVLEQVARQEVLVLEEPKPIVLAQRFADSSIDFTLRVWVPRKEYLVARSNLVKRVKHAFDEQGITIAFPHRTLYIAEVPEISTTSDGLKDPKGGEKPPAGPAPPPKPPKRAGAYEPEHHMDKEVDEPE